MMNLLGSEAIFCRYISKEGTQGLEPSPEVIGRHEVV